MGTLKILGIWTSNFKIFSKLIKSLSCPYLKCLDILIVVNHNIDYCWINSTEK